MLSVYYCNGSIRSDYAGRGRGDQYLGIIHRICARVKQTKIKDTGIHGYKDTGIHGYKDTRIQGTWIQGYKEHGYKDTRNKDTWIQGYRDTRNKDTRTQGQGDT